MRRPAVDQVEPVGVLLEVIAIEDAAAALVSRLALVPREAGGEGRVLERRAECAKREDLEHLVEPVEETHARLLPFR